MKAALHEARHLRRILAETSLRPPERRKLERRVRLLEGDASGVNPVAEVGPVESTPSGVMGVFDRPIPGDVEEQMPKPKQPAPVAPVVEAPAEHPMPATSASEEPGVEPDPPAPAAPQMSAEGIEAVVAQIVGIGDRILRLRAVWATTLSVEIDREAEAWLARLQQLAAKLPREIAEHALGPRMAYLLKQPVRDVSKPTVPQRVQEDMLALSAPNSQRAAILSDIWYAIHQPRRHREPERPPDWLPDGLNQFLL